MNIKKSIISILVLFSFNFLIFSQNYGYSSFGGGLPSSFVEIDDQANESELTPELPLESKSSVKSKKSKSSSTKDTIIITAAIVGGVLVVAGITIGCIALIQESQTCCQSSSNECFNKCADQCAEDMTHSLVESCTTSSFKSVFANLIPIYVP